MKVILKLVVGLMAWSYVFHPLLRLLYLAYGAFLHWHDQITSATIAFGWRETFIFTAISFVSWEVIAVAWQLIRERFFPAKEVE